MSGQLNGHMIRANKRKKRKKRKRKKSNETWCVCVCVCLCVSVCPWSHGVLTYCSAPLCVRVCVCSPLMCTSEGCLTPCPRLPHSALLFLMQQFSVQQHSSTYSFHCLSSQCTHNLQRTTSSVSVVLVHTQHSEDNWLCVIPATPVLRLWVLVDYV